MLQTVASASTLCRSWLCTLGGSALANPAEILFRFFELGLEIVYLILFLLVFLLRTFKCGLFLRCLCGKLSLSRRRIRCCRLGFRDRLFRKFPLFACSRNLLRQRLERLACLQELLFAILHILDFFVEVVSCISHLPTNVVHLLSCIHGIPCSIVGCRSVSVGIRVNLLILLPKMIQHLLCLGAFLLCSLHILLCCMHLVPQVVIGHLRIPLSPIGILVFDVVLVVVTI
mmetsp:Transcript_78/g.233  ORF Transcript_78/g.233 Transcript_78/m.233 type:complete len:229 (+) Transcript_78:69-755(+)